MRRRTLRFTACAAVMALTLSVTACGDGDGSANSEIVQAEQNEEIEAEVEVEEMEAKAREDVQEVEAAAEKAEAEMEAEEAETEEVEEDVDTGDEEYFASLEEAFADPTVKAAMDEQLGSMDMDGMEFSYEVTGNDFIVIYKVLDTVIDDPDDFAGQMDPVMDQLGTIFSAVAEMFDEGIGQPGATTVTVRFLDADDKLLIERSYKAE